MGFKKRGLFAVVLALLLISLFSQSTLSQEVQGCYVYSGASEDLYCVEGVSSSEAQLDCDQYLDCSMGEHFIPGSDCSNIPECEEVTCNVDCQFHASGKCTQLGGQAVPDEEYPLQCNPGCCYIEKASFCEFGRNLFQCNAKATQTLGTFTSADVIFDNSLGMNTNKCLQLYCGGEIQKAILKGVVTDTAGDPVVGAQLLLEAKGVETTTSADGTYQLEIAPGSYQMKVMASGYLSASLSGLLSAGQEVERNIVLSSSEGLVTVEGVVKDSQGNVVQGVTVSWSGPVSGQALTDENGKYVAADLPKGEYAFTAGKVGFTSQVKQITLAAAVTLNFDLQEAALQGLQGKTFIDKNNNNQLDSSDEAVYGSKIYINGVFKGYSQYPNGRYTAEVPAEAEYQISATYQDYGFSLQTVFVKSGQLLSKDLLLTRFIGECTFPNPPKDITEFSVTPIKGKKEVKLTWVKPCPEVINYLITKYQDGVKVDDFTASPAESSKIDADVEWGETYTYEIIAVYDKGQISQTPASRAITLGNEACEGRYLPETGWDLFCVVDDSLGRENVWTCDDNNQPIISSDCSQNNGPGEVYFCAEISEHNAVCKNGGICGVQAQQADPFGLYYTEAACYGSSLPTTEGAANYCYYDYTSSIVNSCERCDTVASCFDYKGKGACTINNCLPSDCAWVDGAASNIMVDYGALFPGLTVPQFVTPETGAGYCVETDYKGDDKCSLCGPEGSLFENTYCTAEVCSGLGRCFSNSVTVSEPLSYCAACGEEPTSETNCYTYTFESECNGGQNLEKNSRQEITVSEDRCGWSRCVWNGNEGGAGSCIKDGDGNSFDDCSVFANAGERNSCRKDNSAPKTKVVAEGLNTVSLTQPSVTFQALDKENPLGKVGYCLASADPNNPGLCVDFTEEPYPGKLKDETVAVNLIDSKYLQQSIPGATYILKFYSKDKYFNQENVQTTFVYVDNVPPQFEINEEIQTAGDTTTLSPYLQGTNEPMECSFELEQILPAGSKQVKSVDRTTEQKKVAFENLQGIKFNLTVTCEDNHGNQKVKGKMYTFDLEERIDLLYPELYGVVDSTSISFKIETVAGASCALYVTQTNEKAADFISDEEGKIHQTEPVPGFVEREYAGEYKVVCEELLTDEQYEDFLHFSVDFTAPNTQIILQEGTRVVEPTGYGWEEFFIESAQINFDCVADGFDCDKTFYCLGEGCELINNPAYKEYSSSIALQGSSKICYYSTDQAQSPVYQPLCGDIVIEGYGVTLEKPTPYTYLTEMWGVSNTAVFPWEFYTKVPTTECAFDFSPSFDYETMPAHKKRELNANNKYLYEMFPADVFSEYPSVGGVKTVYVKCRNLEGELGPEQKINLEFDPTAPKILQASAEPSAVQEGISTTLFIETDDKTACKFSDNSEGDGSSEFDSMEYSFPGVDASVLETVHETEFYISFLGATKEYHLNVACKNGAGDLSETASISFSVDYSAKGSIARIMPSGHLSDVNVTLVVETTKRALCEYKPGDLYMPFPSGLDTVHSTGLGLLEEKKYLIPIRCSIGDHQIESRAEFTIDRTSPSVSEVNDGTFSCGKDAVNVMAYTNEQNISAYYYEVYDLGTSVKAPSEKSSAGNATTSTTAATFSSSGLLAGQLVFNATVGPGLPIKVPTVGLLQDRKYIVKVSAGDAAGNWGFLKDSDGFVTTSGSEEICRNDTGAPAVTILINDSIPESCTSTPVELRCEDIAGCTIMYGKSSSADACVPEKIYRGDKVLFEKTGWVCYAAKDNSGNNYTGSKKINLLDNDGDGVLDSCDQCARTEAGKIADERGCSAGQVPLSQAGIDSDNDGLPDIWEKANDRLDCQLNYLSPDSNSDGISDTLEDYDSDGLSNFEEYSGYLNPCLADAPAKEEFPKGGLPPEQELDVVALLFLLLGFLMVAGGSGYLIYYYLYSEKGKLPSPRRTPEQAPLRPGAPSIAKREISSWKEKLVQLRLAREEKSKLRARASVFRQFNKDSPRIPHIDKFLDKGVSNLPKLQQLAEKYTEHKDEIQPGLRKEEKDIFSKLEDIADKTKDKKIHQVVTTGEAKDIFSQLRKMSKKRKG